MSKIIDYINLKSYFYFIINLLTYKNIEFTISSNFDYLYNTLIFFIFASQLRSISDIINSDISLSFFT